MSNQELFNEACIHHELGRRIDIENFPDVPAAPVYHRTRVLAEELINSARGLLPNLPPIHFDFIEDGEINAYAFKWKNRYFIGFTGGAMGMLHLILNRTLSTQLAFTNIGHPELESPEIPRINWSLLNVERQFDSGVRPIIPQCEIRALYASHLIEQAMMFIVGHEIAHITRGHIDYMATELGLAYVKEFGNDGTSSDAIESQAMEMDADIRSVHARCHSAVLTEQYRDGKGPVWGNGEFSLHNLNYDWSFAMCVFFRLFGDEQFNGLELLEADYPPYAVRQRISIENAIHYFVKLRGEKDLELFRSVFLSAVFASEKAFLSVGASPSRGGLVDSTSQATEDYLQFLYSHRSELMKKLKKYSYEPI